MSLNGFSTNAYFARLVFDPNYTAPQTSGNNFTITGTGVDLTVGFGGATGSTPYSLTAGSESYLDSTGRTDASAYTDFSLQVAGIDWVDGTGALLGSASFHGDGTATLTSVTATPEPTGLALLGTGLVAVIFITRRREITG